MIHLSSGSRLTDLNRSFSQFTHELSAFHEAAVTRKKHSKRLHVHLFETLVGKVRKAERKRKERASRAQGSGPTSRKSQDDQPREEAGDMEIDAASSVEDRELCVREALVRIVLIQPTTANLEPFTLGHTRAKRVRAAEGKHLAKV